ncbi:hypothetical protein V2A60_008865 [Cordyceps javanica]|uniref:Glucan 1, 4-alpha-glucosidase n=1 Tax=Cordyceps javanica TaxID=43265 RepID=A0A545UPT4_9HYPO|nr:glucan 1, 4-alpha-glucosidase [Cordyceps javanica]TQW03096.1 glucan 1, 4-alpha-glucosidase [Cordyceps javanica]
MSVMASRPPNMPLGAGGPSKRPRLSLQIKTTTTTTTTTTTSRPFSLNPSDPTAFNTLSNAYVTAIERSSTPVASPVVVVAAGSGPAAEPLTAINTLQAFTLCSPVRAAPRPATLLATPLSAHPSSSSSASSANVVLSLPSVMSPTPPVSAGALESKTAGRNVFSFSQRDAAAGRRSLEQALHAAAAAAAAATAAAATGSPTATMMPSSPAATPPKEQRPSSTRPAATTTTTTSTLSGSPPPYTHAKALRSILRNSPLPARRPALSLSLSSSSPRRSTPPSVRIQPPGLEHEDENQQQQEQQRHHHHHRHPRAAKRVCYHSPIAQEITTNTYTKSHIDLLVEEAGSSSPSSPSRRHPATPHGGTPPVDLARAFSANEIRDGGQTPGAFEDETRRLGAAMTSTSSSSSSSPVAGGGGGAKRTARGEKKRRWVWTIGREEDAEEDEDQLGGAVVAAARAAAAAAAAEAEAAEKEAEQVDGVKQQQQQKQPQLAPPLLSVPRPKIKLDTSMIDVEMSS